MWQRQHCCKRSTKFFCKDCLNIVGKPSNAIVPFRTLPVQIDIICGDKMQKCTAVYAKLIAKHQVNLIQYDIHSGHLRNHLPSYDPNTTAIAYPSPEATTLDPNHQFQTIIFIDTPWRKAAHTARHPQLAHLPHIKLKNPPPTSKYWRYHAKGPGCISTIEGMCILSNSMHDLFCYLHSIL